MKIGTLGITFTIRLDSDYDIWACETIAAARILAGANSTIYEVVSCANPRNISRWPNKLFLEGFETVGDQLNELDAIILPAQFSPELMASQYNRELPQVHQARTALQEYKGTIYIFVQDAREKFSDWHYRVKEWAPKASVQFFCPADRPKEWLKHLLMELPGGFNQGKNRQGIKYICTFGNFQCSPDRLAVLKHFAPVSTQLVGRAIPKLRYLSCLTDNEVLGTHEFLAITKKAATTLIHIEPCLFERGPWVTSRLVQALKYGLLPLVPDLPKYNELTELVFGEKLAKLWRVRSRAEATEKAESFFYNAMHRHYVLELQWEYIVNLMEWPL